MRKVEEKVEDEEKRLQERDGEQCKEKKERKIAQEKKLDRRSSKKKNIRTERKEQIHIKVREKGADSGSVATDPKRNKSKRNPIDIPAETILCQVKVSQFPWRFAKVSASAFPGPHNHTTTLFPCAPYKKLHIKIYK